MAAALLCLAAAGACGKRGAPLAPLRPVPARVEAVAAELADGRVTLTFTVPDRNLDGTTPPGVERIEVYRTVVDAAADPVPAGQLVAAEHLRATIDIRPPATGETTAPPPSAGRPAPPRAPAAGEPATFSEPAPTPAAGAAPQVWRYVVVGVSGRNRRGPPSAVAAVPIADVPAPPAGVAIEYDEAALRVVWTPVEGLQYLVDQPATEPAAAALRMTPEPVGAPPFSQPVVFGDRRCATVRAVRVVEQVRLIGPASAPVCVTPADTFPPPAPERLVATADVDGVALSWSQVSADDLAGYLVLRGVGAGDTLTPLVAAPIADAAYRDTTAAAGETYTYVVVAVDRRDNRSAHSNRQTIRRQPAGADRHRW